MDKIKFDSVYTNVPVEYVVVKDDNRFIKLGGLLYLADQMGTVRLIPKVLVATENEYVYECTGYIVPSDKYLEEKGFTNEIAKELFKIPTVATGCAKADIVEWGKNKEGKIESKVIVRGNANANMQPHLRTLAETRSVSRCLRFLTNTSATSYEEMGMQESLDAAVKEQLKIMEASGKLAMIPEIETAGEFESKEFTRESCMKNIDSLKKSKGARAVKLYSNYLDKKGAAIIANLDDDALKELESILSTV